MTKIKKLSFICIIMLVLLFPIVFCACGENTNTNNQQGEWETLTNVDQISFVARSLVYYDVSQVRINRKLNIIQFNISSHSKIETALSNVIIFYDIMPTHQTI